MSQEEKESNSVEDCSQFESSTGGNIRVKIEQEVVTSQNVSTHNNSLNRVMANTKQMAQKENGSQGFPVMENWEKKQPYIWELDLKMMIITTVMEWWLEQYMQADIDMYRVEKQGSTSVPHEL